MKISRQLLEIASWRVATEVARQAPDELQIIETHPGGGLYDCLSIIHAGETDLCGMNRAGSGITCFARTDGTPVAAHESSPQWSDLLEAEDPRRIVSDLCRRLGITMPDPLPSSTPRVIVYRIISAFLGSTSFGAQCWSCRNGYNDTSGYGGGPREEWFALFPATRAARREREPDDVLGEPLYRFWFLTLEEDPVICLSTSGLAWDREGHNWDVAKLYRARHRVWPVIQTIFRDKLP